MTLDRRSFVAGSLAGSVAAGLAAARGSNTDRPTTTGAPAPTPAKPAKNTILALHP
jgi:hypothetical protein